MGQAEAILDLSEDELVAAAKGDLLVEHCLGRPHRTAVVGHGPTGDGNGLLPPIRSVYQAGVGQQPDSCPNIDLDLPRFDSGDLRRFSHEGIDRLTPSLKEPAGNLIDHHDPVGHQVVDSHLGAERSDEQSL